MNRLIARSLVSSAHLRADPYKVLGVSRKMSPKEIHSEYLKKTMSCHPDIHGDEKKNEYLELQKAYEQIKEMGTKGGQEWSGSAFTSEKGQQAKQSSPTSFKFMANATEWNNSRAFMSNANLSEQLESTSVTGKNYMESTKDPRFFTKQNSEDTDDSGNQGSFFQKLGLSDKLKQFRDGLERKKE